MLRVSLEASSPGRDAVDRLSEEFGLELGSGDGWRLVHTGERLELHPDPASGYKPFAVDFSTIDVRTGAGNLSRKQPIARALGRGEHVADLTAGFGHDAMLLALMGFRVTAVERSPVVAALLADGVRRAREHPELGPKLADRIEVVYDESATFIRRGGITFDAAYVDPMFPPKRKQSALPPRSMQIARLLVGEDADRAELLCAARSAVGRVVMKCPTYAPALGGEPDLTFGGKLVRYDVFLASSG